MKQLLDEYRVMVNQAVIWGDMDAFGHINNTVYFRYFEDVRIAYFDQIGIHKIKDELNLGPILAQTQANFRLPLKYPDQIHIAGRSTVLGPKKFSMHYCVYSETLDAIAAEGEGLLVFYDYSNSVSCEIPQSIVAAIEALEG